MMWSLAQSYAYCCSALIMLYFMCSNLHRGYVTKEMRFILNCMHNSYVVRIIHRRDPSLNFMHLNQGSKLLVYINDILCKHFEHFIVIKDSGTKFSEVISVYNFKMVAFVLLIYRVLVSGTILVTNFSRLRRRIGRKEMGSNFQP